MRYLEFGIFLPIAKNGFIASTTTAQFMPTWELNRDVTLKCEELGFEFALSMVKHRGFGGVTEYWDYAQETAVPETSSTRSRCKPREKKTSSTP